METKHHTFKVTRPGQSETILVLVVALCIVTAQFLAQSASGIWDIIFYIGSIALGLLAGKMINNALNSSTSGEASFSIADDTVSLHWLKPIHFSPRPDVTFQLSDIRDYSFTRERIKPGLTITSSQFGLTLKSGQSINLSAVDEKEEAFGQFITALREAIVRYNSLHAAHPILPRQNIFQKKAGLFISSGLLASFAVLPLLMTHVPETSKIAWILIYTFYFTAVLFMLATLFNRWLNSPAKREAIAG